ncbi:hypothetical protein F2P56_003667, partial [Juglans regia]
MALLSENIDISSKLALLFLLTHLFLQNFGLKPLKRLCISSIFFPQGPAPDEPTSYSVTSKLPECRAAMATENDALLRNNTWSLQPQGFIDPKFPNHVCKLLKAIYGLKQAPRAWFAKLTSWLNDYGFVASQSDPSLFILHRGDLHIFLLIYVDDMVITSSHPHAIDVVIRDLSMTFPVKDLGSLSYFLGLEVDYCDSSIILSQRKYIKDLLARSNMLQAKSISSPMAASLKLSQFDAPAFDDYTLIRSIVGGLQYLSYTRLDISFAVNKVCQFMHSPKLTHWSAVKRILRYLKGTINHGLLFKYTSSFTLQAYCDADWGGCPDDRRSTSGFCLYLGSHLISWSSKKQKTVARSSIEAEYKALSHTAAELIW